MCEIAILNPREHSVEELTTVAMQLYESQKSSLGIAFISESADRERFEYSIYRDISPDAENVAAFIEAWKSDAVRVLIHGRLATHGAVSTEHSHPLRVECDECDIDYIAHNGVAYNYHRRFKKLRDKGHEFSTEVDSEVLAHEYGEVPTDFEGITGRHTRQPAYILMNEKSVYIVASGRYRLTEKGTMSLPHRNFGPDVSDNYSQVILSPTNAE